MKSEALIPTKEVTSANYQYTNSQTPYFLLGGDLAFEALYDGVVGAMKQSGGDEIAISEMKTLLDHIQTSLMGGNTKNSGLKGLGQRLHLITTVMKNQGFTPLQIQYVVDGAPKQTH